MVIEFSSYFVAAFIAAIGFGILYNVPTKTLLTAGLIGGIGWITYYIVSSQFDLGLFFGASVASFLIALLSQFMARRFFMPVIVFTIPGIMPLVPGGAAYNMMRSFVEGNMESALTYTTETFLISGAIALGISVNSALFQIFSSKKFGRKGRGRRYLP